MKGKAFQHSYRLRLTPVGPAVPHEIEFEAPSPESALRVAHSVCGAGKAELFEDGRHLASLQLSSPHGFWIVS